MPFPGHESQVIPEIRSTILMVIRPGIRRWSKISKVLNKQLRADDMLVRYGGRKFLVVFLGTSVDKEKEKTVRNWIPKSEALKKAEVSAFDAKRYLSSLSQFVPSDRTLMKGGAVLWCVPEIFKKFKKLEESGVSLEQIEQTIANQLALGGQPGAGPAVKPEHPSVMVEVNKLLPLLFLIQQVMENQENMDSEIVKLIQLIEEKLMELQFRIDRLEQAAKLK